MTAPLFTPAEPTWLAAAHGPALPVARVFCVGRNYAAHAREMGKDPDREPPFFFTKWPEAVVNAAPQDEAVIAFPPETANYHHEVELVVAIGRAGFRIPESAALEHVYGYAVGLDMTRRDRQLEARDKGRPWDVGKNIPQSCPTGRLAPASATGHLASGAIGLSVNGAVRQEADLADLIWSVPEVIADVSRFYALRPGDLIYTGTPAGVNRVGPGDVLEGWIDGLPPLAVTIGPEA